MHISEDMPCIPLGGSWTWRRTLGSADGDRLSVVAQSVEVTLKLCQNEPGDACTPWGKSRVVSASPFCVTRVLLLVHVICCNPRQLSEVGGRWQQISLDLECEERTADKMTAKLVQEGDLSCLLLSTAHSIAWSPGCPWASELAMALSSLVIEQGTSFKEQ